MPEDRVTTVATSPEGSKEEKRAVPIPAVAGLIFAVAALIGILLLSLRPQSPPAPPSQEDLAYASQLALTDLSLSAEKNFLGQQVVYLDGKITNRGAKTLRQLKLRLFFRDTLNQVVLKEDQEFLGARSESLGPGQTQKFQIRFDRIPDSWTRQVPQFQLISLQIQ